MTKDTSEFHCSLCFKVILFRCISFSQIQSLCVKLVTHWLVCVLAERLLPAERLGEDGAKGERNHGSVGEGSASESGG